MLALSALPGCPHRVTWRPLAALLGLALTGCDSGTTMTPLPPVDHPVQYVSPFIGSGGFGYHYGSAFPGATAPHGLAKVGPDTSGPWATINFLHYCGYWYGDNVVQGFSHMHLHGTGATDYGVLGFMPVPAFDPAALTQDTYGSPFQKQSEEAEPGYYALTLDHGPVRAEITATPHAAHHRYTFMGQGGAPTVLIDLNHTLGDGKVDSAEIHLQAGAFHGKLHSLGGMSGGYGGYEVYFSGRARTPWTSAMVWSKGSAPAAGQDASGTVVGAALSFAAGAPVELQVGLSLVSEDEAAANLAAEMSGWDFDGERKAAAQVWDTLLSAVLVEGGSEDDRRVFYSALYKAFLMPSVHSDVDGSFRGNDGVVYKADGFHFVSDLSLWDTYRTVQQLYVLLAPPDALDAVRSLHEMAKEKGSFPKWPLAGGDSGSMVGAGAAVVVADTYLRGLTGFDAEGAYQILRAAALNPTPPAGGRGGMDSEDYLRLGFVPGAGGGGVSRTCEFARDDAALANLAAALGHADDAAALQKRSQGWQKLYDPQVGFLRGRNADLSWGMPAAHFDPTVLSMDYVEADAWQTLFLPSHDLSGLTGLLGGTDGFLAKLGAFFDGTQQDWDGSDPTSQLEQGQPRPYYWPGNEPSLHIAYLYAQLGRPDLAAKWVRWTMQSWFGPGPDGSPGNDDGGTMGSWYVLSALGLYPEEGTDRFILGVPLFDRAKVRVTGGTFTIEAEGLSADHPYVQQVTLDGAPLSGPYLKQGEVRAGRVLHFVMGAAPVPGPV